MGGTLREVPVTGPVRPDVVSAKAMVWGVEMPWNLLLTVGLGVWLMLTTPSGTTRMPKNMTIHGIVRHRRLSPMKPIRNSTM